MDFITFFRSAILNLLALPSKSPIMRNSSDSESEVVFVGPDSKVGLLATVIFYLYSSGR
jgi:hypothetical protein